MRRHLTEGLGLRLTVRQHVVDRVEMRFEKVIDIQRLEHRLGMALNVWAGLSYGEDEGNIERATVRFRIQVRSPSFSSIIVGRLGAIEGSQTRVSLSISSGTFA